FQMLALTPYAQKYGFLYSQQLFPLILSTIGAYLVTDFLMLDTFLTPHFQSDMLELKVLPLLLYLQIVFQMTQSLAHNSVFSFLQNYVLSPLLQVDHTFLSFCLLLLV